MNGRREGKVGIGRPDQAGRPLLRHRLDAERRRGREAHLARRLLRLQELEQVLRVLRARVELDARVDVF